MVDGKVTKQLHFRNVLDLIQGMIFQNLWILAMPRVETRGSENEEESKQRC